MDIKLPFNIEEEIKYSENKCNSYQYEDFREHPEKYEKPSFFYLKDYKNKRIKFEKTQMKIPNRIYIEREISLQEDSQYKYNFDDFEHEIEFEQEVI